LVIKGGAVLASPRVWKAAASPVDVGIKDDLYITFPRGQAADVKTAVDVQPRLIAPLSLDANVGQLRVFAGNQTLATLPVHPLKSVAAGGWWRRLIDTIRLWFA
jgi:D-alanyl-D-alanine carboxypeptidase (penicillin-binding protein 5/6)